MMRGLRFGSVLLVLSGFGVWLLSNVQWQYKKRTPELLNVWVQADAELLPFYQKLVQDTELAKMRININIQSAPHSFHPSEYLKSISDATGVAGEVLVSPPFDLFIGSSQVGARLCEQGLVNCHLDSRLVEGLDERLIHLVQRKGQSFGVPLFFSEAYVIFYDREKIPLLPRALQDIEKTVAPFNDPYRGFFGVALAEDSASFLLFLTAGNFFTVAAKKADKSLAIKRAFETLQDLQFLEALVPHHCSAECVVRIFRERRAPLAIAPLEHLHEFQKVLGDRLGLAPLPTLDQDPMRSPYDGQFAFVSAHLDQDKKSAVENFLNFLSSPFLQERIATVWGRRPANLHVVQNQNVKGARLIRELLSATEQSLVLVPWGDVQQLTSLAEKVLNPFHQGRLTPEAAAAVFAKSLSENSMTAE